LGITTNKRRGKKKEVMPKNKQAPIYGVEERLTLQLAPQQKNEIQQNVTELKKARSEGEDKSLEEKARGHTSLKPIKRKLNGSVKRKYIKCRIGEQKNKTKNVLNYR